MNLYFHRTNERQPSTIQRRLTVDTGRDSMFKSITKNTNSTARISADRRNSQSTVTGSVSIPCRQALPDKTSSDFATDTNLRRKSTATRWGPVPFPQQLLNKKSQNFAPGETSVGKVSDGRRYSQSMAQPPQPLPNRKVQNLVQGTNSVGKISATRRSSQSTETVATIQSPPPLPNMTSQNFAFVTHSSVSPYCQPTVTVSRPNTTKMSSSVAQVTTNQPIPLLNLPIASKETLFLRQLSEQSLEKFATNMTGSTFVKHMPGDMHISHQKNTISGHVPLSQHRFKPKIENLIMSTTTSNLLRCVTLPPNQNSQSTHTIELNTNYSSTMRYSQSLQDLSAEQLKCYQSVTEMFNDPCVYFLAGQDCTFAVCTGSHNLPSNNAIFQAILQFSTDKIRFIYENFVVKNKQTFLQYLQLFSVMFGNRRMEQDLESLVEDCEYYGKIDFLEFVRQGLLMCNKTEAEATQIILKRSSNEIKEVYNESIGK